MERIALLAAYAAFCNAMIISAISLWAPYPAITTKAGAAAGAAATVDAIAAKARHPSAA